MTNNRGRIFRIGGVAGCGKTTLTAVIDKLVRESDMPFASIDTRLLQCELAGVRSEKMYRKIPEEKRRELFPLITQRIIEIADQQPNKIWYFERHLCSMNEEGDIIARGITDDHGERMVGLAIILACENQIETWRKMDKGIRKDRHLLTPAQILIEQATEIELALESSRYWNFPVHLFFNQQGCCLRQASEIFSFLKRVFKKFGEQY